MTAPKQTPVIAAAKALAACDGLLWIDLNYVQIEQYTWRAQAALEACHADEMIAALNEIACWGDGDTVGGWFDEPGAAKTARAMLAKLEALPTPTNAFGYCPLCGAPGHLRSKTPDADGNTFDLCTAGHKYNSRDALAMNPGVKP